MSDLQKRNAQAYQASIARFEQLLGQARQDRVGMEAKIATLEARLVNVEQLLAVALANTGSGPTE